MTTRLQAPDTRHPKNGIFTSAYCSLPGANRASRGFTLVEMIVAVALFAVVMLVSVGALLALVGANRKAQALQSVINNLNISLDGMVRAIRMGSQYHCGTSSYSVAQDCADNESGDTTFAFEPYGGDLSLPGDQWVYSYDAGSKRIYKSVDGGASSVAITAPGVRIDSLKFYVIGTTRGDTVQPKIVITVKGTAGADQVKTSTTFSIQATAVQRLLDL